MWRAALWTGCIVDGTMVIRGTGGLMTTIVSLGPMRCIGSLLGEYRASKYHVHSMYIPSKVHGLHTHFLPMYCTIK
jgi:hypothetical protein